VVMCVICFVTNCGPGVRDNNFSSRSCLVGRLCSFEWKWVLLV
jgi:hypothetical protein